MGRIMADKELKKEFLLDTDKLLGVYNQEGQESAYKCLALLEKKYENAGDKANTRYVNKSILKLANAIKDDEKMKKMTEKEKFYIKLDIECKEAARNKKAPPAYIRPSKDSIKKMEEETNVLLERGNNIGLDVSKEINEYKKRKYVSFIMAQMYTYSNYKDLERKSILPTNKLTPRTKKKAENMKKYMPDLEKETFPMVYKIAERAVKCGASKRELSKYIKNIRYNNPPRSRKYNRRKSGSKENSQRRKKQSP